jgi:hypothetical protein
VERDETDYSALFESAQSGQVILGNIVNSTYTGVISGSATLEFYPSNTTAATTMTIPPAPPIRFFPSFNPTGRAASMNRLSCSHLPTSSLPRFLFR